MSQVPWPVPAAIVDIGAGTGDEASVLAEFGHVHLLEPDRGALAGIPMDDRWSRVQGVVNGLPIKNECVDGVVMFDVLEHLADDEGAVREVYRILKFGRPFIFTVPAHPRLMSAHDHALGHYRRYHKARLRALLAAFHLVQMGYWNSTLFPLAALSRFVWRAKQPRVQKASVPAVMNRLLFGILKMESRMIGQGWALPPGLSLFGIALKR